MKCVVDTSAGLQVKNKKCTKFHSASLNKIDTSKKNSQKHQKFVLVRTVKVMHTIFCLADYPCSLPA